MSQPSGFALQPTPLGAMAAAFLGGAAAWAGTALVNSPGKLAGSTTTNIVGWLAGVTHGNSASLDPFAGVLAASGVLTLAIFAPPGEQVAM